MLIARRITAYSSAGQVGGGVQLSDVTGKRRGELTMSNILAELEQKAAQLSPAERAQLALSLIQSLEPTDEGDLEEAWRLEAEARLAQIEKGEARVVPGDEVFTTVRRRLS